MRTKSGSMPVQLLRKDLCKLICVKEYSVQDRLATVRTDWKLHVWRFKMKMKLAMNMPMVSEAAPVTWSMRCSRRQRCSGCGCCRFCRRWRQGCPLRESSHGQTACEPAKGGAVVNYEVSWDWRFQLPRIPPSFRDQRATRAPTAAM